MLVLGTQGWLSRLSGLFPQSAPLPGSRLRITTPKGMKPRTSNAVIRGYLVAYCRNVWYVSMLLDFVAQSSLSRDLDDTGLLFLYLAVKMNSVIARGC